VTRIRGMASVLVPIAALFAGCSIADQIDPNAKGDGLIELLLSPKPVTGTVADAQDPYDADKRTRGTLGLSMTPAGSEPVFVALYAANAKDAEPSVRAAAARALGRHGGPEQASLLIDLLRDTDAGVREEACRALQRIHDPAAVDPLLAATREPEGAKQGEEESKVRAQAAMALAQYRERRVVQGLIGALSDTSLAVNRNALSALRTLTGQDLGYDQRRWLAWAKDASDPFAGASVFQFPVYSRGPLFYERLPLPFITPAPNETSGPPAGVPLGPR